MFYNTACLVIKYLENTKLVVLNTKLKLLFTSQSLLFTYKMQIDISPWNYKISSKLSYLHFNLVIKSKTAQNAVIIAR